jgi:uncharacterized membrane protein
MNDLRHIDLRDPTIKPRPSPARTGKKVIIGLLAVLLVSAMIAWLTFLGWGMVEILQWLSVWFKSFWTRHF